MYSAARQLSWTIGLIMPIIGAPRVSNPIEYTMLLRRSCLLMLDSRFLILFRGELFIAPIQNPETILDLGTGTGIWAMDVAE